MTDDLRCCGRGSCLIDAQGRCWCGQQWDGQKMCFVAPSPKAAGDAADAANAVKDDLAD